LVNKRAVAGFAAAASLVFAGTASATDIYTRVLNQHPKVARSMCKGYNQLINLGWTDSSIYEVMKDAGKLNNRTEFNAIVRWCWNH
jgi:hypothetical protein